MVQTLDDFDDIRLAGRFTLKFGNNKLHGKLNLPGSASGYRYTSYVCL